MSQKIPVERVWNSHKKREVPVRHIDTFVEDIYKAGEKKKSDKRKKVLWIGLIIALFVILAVRGMAQANADVLDDKIKRFCHQHELAQEEVFGWEKSRVRCTLILQGQIRFETLQCTVGNGLKNNCFWFRGGKRSDWQYKYGMFYDGTGSYRFKDKTGSIIFAVDHYYEYQRYKTITQIIQGGYYCSPVSGWCGHIEGFARTTPERYANYIHAVRKYYKDNLHLYTWFKEIFYGLEVNHETKEIIIY